MLLRNRDWSTGGRRWPGTGTARGYRSSTPPAPVTRTFRGPEIRARRRPERARAGERAETAARVMAGSLAKAILRDLGVDIVGHVLSIGRYRCRPGSREIASRPRVPRGVRCGWRTRGSRPRSSGDRRVEGGRHHGRGVVEVIAGGSLRGLGSYVAWDRRLDGRLGQALMCIPAIKGWRSAAGLDWPGCRGSTFTTRCSRREPRGRSSGNICCRSIGTRTGPGAGGGMTNGEPVVVRAAMKPIPTQSVPLRTVTVDRFVASTAHRERSDVCAVPAASVVAETMVAIVLADAFLEKFGGDTMRDILYNYSGYLQRICGGMKRGALFPGVVLVGSWWSGKSSVGRQLAPASARRSWTWTSGSSRRRVPDPGSLRPGGGAGVPRAGESGAARRSLRERGRDRHGGRGILRRGEPGSPPFVRPRRLPRGRRGDDPGAGCRGSRASAASRGRSEEVVRELLSRRVHGYRTADVTVRTDGRTVEEVAGQVADWIDRTEGNAD